jgi:hypothetical protein
MISLRCNAFALHFLAIGIHAQVQRMTGAVGMQTSALMSRMMSLILPGE